MYSGRPYPRPNFSVPDTFTMVLDLEAGSLAFKADNIRLNLSRSQIALVKLASPAGIGSEAMQFLRRA